MVPIAVGSVVKLKGQEQAPAMTVEKFVSGKAHCIWFDQNYTFHEADFREVILEKISD